MIDPKLFDELNKQMALHSSIFSSVNAVKAMSPASELLSMSTAFDRLNKIELADQLSSANTASATFDKLNATMGIENKINVVNAAHKAMGFANQLSASTNLTRAFENISIKNSMLLKACQEQHHIQSILASNSRMSALAELDTSRVLSVSLMAQAKLAELDRFPLGKLAKINNDFVQKLAVNFSDFTDSYKSLVDSVAMKQDIYQPVSLISTYSPVEYYRELEVLESITVEDREAEDENEVEISEVLFESIPSADEILENYDSRLCRLLQGARYSLSSDNPDRVRHVTTSIRELFTHVLHTLAPDSEIRKWSTEDQYFHNNRPTRRARLLYICRHINNNSFQKFVEHDVRAVLSFVEALNGDTHSIEPRLTEHQLKALVARMESLLVFLLQIPNVGE
ncbi:hypothetical protein [Spirulina sp. 06S082]|uniref:pPIWI-associating nuclease domain-containing protein n=1 Tax=Spirulina sp. 06S082 TaxID=3110248 RepID=UPI002B219E3A|nr:hypothetical protein [Spirulina sp. 06S082]MEA5470158.1 hypothetical protein [Spirulina sp. 06S082]